LKNNIKYSKQKWIIYQKPKLISRPRKSISGQRTART